MQAVSKDYSTNENKNPGPWDTYAKPNPFDNCWYSLPVFRKLWPEYGDLSDDALVQSLYAKIGRNLETIDPLAATKRFGLLGVLPPAVFSFWAF
ncbi:hypothetical protein X769_15675 [Mesorhizobium sp. LSJC268A00]|uniref:hypothetical protein n=1 Tax=Mesorhizobium sp. LSJC268A00 TaxID=1287325 RepID=UPI0003CDECE7|nr:hypothetical protein [Mesorhizobium sp. LSJC268A00]ESX03914.1 hypothetical protein X769_15675 [Mesorhizobium sp. LSJC268A00]ESZ10776.1 hypothetical protein X735_27595 [Mesorhizobium sp. L2C085B000]